VERIQSINPKRIAWCCEDYGITVDQLAAETGVSAVSIKRVMEGDDALTFNQLRKIAAYFGRGVLFFLEQGTVDESQVRSPQFRTLANQKPELSPPLKALIERVEAQRAVYLSLREDLDEAEQLTFMPPKLPPAVTPREAAKIVRDWLDLTESNTFDSYREAVEARGVLVFRTNGYNGKWQIAKNNPVLGFALYDAQHPVIVVKKMQWESKQSFTLMHELGHLVLHKSSSIDDDADMRSNEGMERQANTFAGYLLVPDAFLEQIDDGQRPNEVTQYDNWLEKPRKTWGVSAEVILRRLFDAGRLRESSYVAYRKWRSSVVVPEKDGGNRKYRYREPKHIFGDKFVRTVLDALDARHITLAKASSYLDSVKITDVRQLERLYAGV
jgi:Zn-dependent peptidase ImmA (M78 family)/plasmid maintenance system antidote protein VapI